MGSACLGPHTSELHNYKPPAFRLFLARTQREYSTCLRTHSMSGTHSGLWALGPETPLQAREQDHCGDDLSSLKSEAPDR